MSAYFGEIRSIVHDVLSSPERVDALVWMLCDERSTTQDVAYALEALRHREVGRVNVSELVRWCVEGVTHLEDVVDAVVALRPTFDLLKPHDVREYVSSIAWQVVACEGELGRLRSPGNWLCRVRAQSEEWIGLSLMSEGVLSCKVHLVNDEEERAAVDTCYRRCVVGARVWPGLNGRLGVEHDWESCALLVKDEEE